MSEPHQATKTSAPVRRASWRRFWIEVLIGVTIFNIIAGLVTWLYLWPRLHPHG